MNEPARKPCPEPGIYENIDFGEYLSWDAVNNSSLSLAKRSLAHYRYSEPKEPTPFMRLGTLAHAGALEPLSIARRYVVMPPFENEARTADGRIPSNPKSTAAYRKRVAEFELANQGKEIVDQATYDMMVGIVEAMYASERARSYLMTHDPVEVGIVWDDPETGLRCKGRVDKLQREQNRLVDIKTTVDATDFGRSIARFGYHRQAAFYADGIFQLTGIPHEFCLVVAEREKPYGVRAAPLHEEAIAEGRREYRELLRKIAHAKTTDHWPGYEDPDTWRLPEWAIAQASDDVALTIGGEALHF